MKESKGWEFLTAFEEIDEKYIYQAAKPWKENKIKKSKNIKVSFLLYNYLELYGFSL